MKIDPRPKPPQQSPDFPDSFHRVTVKGVYVKDGKVLMSHDFVSPDDPVWELPGGGLDFGEPIVEGLKRGIEEEMGLEVTWIADKPTYVYASKKEQWRGMDWYYVLVLIYQIDIKTLDCLKKTDECRDIKFFTKEELLSEPTLNDQIQGFAERFDPADFKQV